MAFNWGTFLATLAELAPIIVAGTAQLSGEASTASKTQLATDSLNLATGVSGALLSQNTNDVALAGIASQITQSIISATSLAHAVTGQPTLEAPTTPQAAAAAVVQPAIVSGAAKQVG